MWCVQCGAEGAGGRKRAVSLGLEGGGGGRRSRCGACVPLGSVLLRFHSREGGRGAPTGRGTPLLYNL